MKLGQSSFEYLMVVGIAMLLIVPGAFLFFNYSQRSSDEMLRSQVESVGNSIIDAVEKVYYIGENTWETVKISVPENVRWIYIVDNSELVIEYDSQAGVGDAVFFSDINITAPPEYRFGGRSYISNITNELNQAGFRMIRVSSMGDFVLINETT